MRKFIIVLAAVIVALGLFSPAEAAKKKSFSVSLSPAPSGTQKKFNDTSLDLDSAHGPAHGRTTIRGKVKGKHLKGKKVALYATNMHTQAKRRTYLGSAELNSRGYFSKKFSPSKGHAGLYKIEVVKKASSGRAADTKTFYIRVFEWISLDKFHDSTSTTPGLVARADKEPVGPSVRERWSVSYALAGGSTVAFNFSGYRCVRFNLKVGVSETSSGGSTTYTVGQPDRTIMSGSKSKGGGFDEPARGPSESINPNLPFTVSNTGDSASRMILGLPKAACMYPYKVAPTPF